MSIYKKIEGLKFIDNIIVATTENRHDDKIVSISNKLKVDCLEVQKVMFSKGDKGC